MTESVTERIDVPFPDEENLILTISAVPARLLLTVGDGPDWVSGQYVDPSGMSRATVRLNKGNLDIGHERLLQSYRHGVPSMELELGASRPFALEIQSGASDRNRCELGGLKLTRFDCKQGAGKLIIHFASPNQVEMTRFSVTSGASSLRLGSLVNANASEIKVVAGAADLSVDFLGELQRDIRATVQAGMADVKIGIDPEQAIAIRASSTLGSVTIDEGFRTTRNGFENDRAHAGERPLLSLDLTTAVGALAISQIRRLESGA